MTTSAVGKLLEAHDLRRWARFVNNDGSFSRLRCCCGFETTEDTNEAMFGHIADILATAPPEQAEAHNQRHPEFRYTLDGKPLPMRVQRDLAEAEADRPQAASAGALRKAICNILVFGKPDAQITAELELLFERRLAAHDQKVRAEVLETALEAVGGATDLLQAYARIRSLAGAVEKEK